MDFLSEKWRERWERYAPIVKPAAVLIVFVFIVALLFHELRSYKYSAVVDGFRQIPTKQVVEAIALTVLNYLVMILYDYTAIRYLGHKLPLRKVALASFVGYAVGYNFGWFLGGTSVRLRFYTAWGLSAIDIAKLIAMLGLTFWLGYIALAGVVFVLQPLELPEHMQFGMTDTRPIGIMCLVCTALYLGACVFRRKPVSVLGWQFSFPPLGMAVLQIFIASLDLLVAASVLQALLPPMAGVHFGQVVALFLFATAAVIFANVPGGLGVFEYLVPTLLGHENEKVFACVLVYRAVYYLLPLMAASVLVAINEAYMRKESVGKLMGTTGGWGPVVASRILAVNAFLAGAVLIFSGALPAEDTRFDAWAPKTPLAVIELSHFLSCITGVTLLFLARGLFRRVHEAYFAAVGLLVVGIVCCLLKGLAFEEALLLGTMLVVFFFCRDDFQRHGEYFVKRLTFTWTIALIIVLVCAVGVALFGHQQVEYTHALWGTFSHADHAARSLRGTMAAVCVSLLLGLWALLKPRTEAPHVASSTEVAAAEAVARKAGPTYAYLALMRDKYLLFNEPRNAFLMYGIAGRSWVSLRDPVGPAEAGADLAWRFREMCEAEDAWPVFYQVDESRLPLYVDLGLELLKMGEEAVVPLADFHLEARPYEKLRLLHRQARNEELSFELLPPAAWRQYESELSVVSREWLGGRKAREKKFSFGSFNLDYLEYFPLAVARRDGRIVAFANVWQGAEKEEMAVDLYRQLPQAPPVTMDFLFTELALWGQREGYRHFDLGVAPLAGEENARLASLWNRVGTLLYQRADFVQDFDALRQFKLKFCPQWRGKYLAVPGGLALPLILTNIATLISGDSRRSAKGEE